MDILADFIVRVLTAIIAGLILSYPAMLLWNSCLVPAVNGVNQIGWLQTWGITVLFGLMFPRTGKED